MIWFAYTVACMAIEKETLGWGVRSDSGVEIWDTDPVVTSPKAGPKDWLRLLFYPKKFLLYRAIARAEKNKRTDEPFRILDVGCGTGASVIDLKKIFGAAVDVVGIDVVPLQIDIAKRKIGEYGVACEVSWYDGLHIPFPDASFDAVYSSDVLGHVRDVPAWLGELRRVLKPGGVVAMFAESKLGQHAWIRKYLFDRGLNVDPHAQFHISLFSKTELQELFASSRFAIQQMYCVFWPAFILHPEEFYSVLSLSKDFPLLRTLNRFFTWLKKKTHPYSTAAVELYGLVEMLTIGRWVESQGYIILAKKE